MDFKIGDEIEGEGTNKSKLKVKSNLPLILIIILSLVVGLTVFFLSNSLFGPKKTKKEEPTRQQLNLNESNVKILYSYITDETSNKTREIFVREPKVTIDTFTNKEKFDCALQFAGPEDFEFTGKYKDPNSPDIKQKIYVISDITVKKYMTRFFGNKIDYLKDEEITHNFSFKINDQSFGVMKYSEEAKGYETIFETPTSTDNIKLVDDYYTELTGAYKELDGTYTLEEKAIYPEVTSNGDNNYTLSIYKDFEHTNLIEKKSDVSKEELNKIDVTKYKNQAATITYKFVLNGNILYFGSSSIKN